METYKNFIIYNHLREMQASHIMSTIRHIIDYVEEHGVHVACSDDRYEGYTLPLIVRVAFTEHGPSHIRLDVQKYKNSEETNLEIYLSDIYSANPTPYLTINNDYKPMTNQGDDAMLMQIADCLYV